jgi:hypothetical protein
MAQGHRGRGVRRGGKVVLTSVSCSRDGRAGEGSLHQRPKNVDGVVTAGRRDQANFIGRAAKRRSTTG